MSTLEHLIETPVDAQWQHDFALWKRSMSEQDRIEEFARASELYFRLHSLNTSAAAPLCQRCELILDELTPVSDHSLRGRIFSLRRDFT